MIGPCAKFLAICLLAAISIAESGKVLLPHKSIRVIGGEPAEIKDRPYLVQLRTSDYGLFKCGGTLVDSIYVVTAAHCVQGVNPVKDYVVVGDASTIFADGVKRKIIASFVHPKYGQGHQYANDAAVLKLESPMTGTYAKPIGMAFDDIADEEFVTISGWGKTEEGVTGTVELIRTARVAKIPQAECISKYSTYKGVTSSMICAATPGKDACQGDSGGPAIYHNKLYAIVSWGKGCAQPDYPGIYTSLKSVKDFITQSIKK